MTISTLTGHVVISYGHCAAIIDNGPAKSVSYAQNLQATGEGFGQLLEISKLIYEVFFGNSSIILFYDRSKYFRILISTQQNAINAIYDRGTQNRQFKHHEVIKHRGHS